MENPVEQASAIVGSATKLARVLGVTKSAVHQWKLPGRKVPIEKCLAIERATGGRVTRGELRPHDAHLIWPDIASGSAEHSGGNPETFRPAAGAGGNIWPEVPRD